MNKVTFYFILLITTVSLFSCSKEDAVTIPPPRDYAEQYKTDIADIEEYLKKNYITVVNHSGFVDDQNVTITKIDAGQPSIYSYLNATTFPKLLSRNVSQNNITYTLYYLVLREGIGTSPCNVDGVLTSYKGDYLSRDATTKVLSATKFEEVIYPQSMLSLFSVITGWSETFPQFKTGTYTTNADGTGVHKDFGAGVIFIPSGLAYYNTGAGSIPSYSPLVFSFKLYGLERLDQDNDGILSYQEDLDGDKYVKTLATGVVNADDTDKDGFPNFLDVDDDGDNYTTKLEIKNPATGLPYSFDLIPDCAGNVANPTRIKKHLDKNCH